MLKGKTSLTKAPLKNRQEEAKLDNAYVLAS
jgi:hypothetical protein